MLISIDGNIGAGKSTLINSISKYNDNVTVIPEPVKLWEPLLKKYSENPKKYAYELQQQTAKHYINIKKQIKQMSKNNNTHYKEDPLIIIIERSLATSINVFAKYQYHQKFINQKQWNKFQETYSKHKINFDCRVMICTSTDICMFRINKRSRSFESMIPKTYLDELQTLHIKNYSQFEQLSEQTHQLNGNLNKMRVLLQFNMFMNKKLLMSHYLKFIKKQQIIFKFKDINIFYRIIKFYDNKFINAHNIIQYFIYCNIKNFVNAKFSIKIIEKALNLINELNIC